RRVGEVGVGAAPGDHQAIAADDVPVGVDHAGGHVQVLHAGLGCPAKGAVAQVLIADVAAEAGDDGAIGAAGVAVGVVPAKEHAEFAPPAGLGPPEGPPVGSGPAAHPDDRCAIAADALSARAAGRAGERADALHPALGRPAERVVAGWIVARA